jgi:broad specificity phosphatase PhoE
MPRLYLVRHGRAAATFAEAADPGLDAVGHAQAEAVAEHLAKAISPIALISSPLKRTRETSEPLAKRWQHPVPIEPAVAEIPSPDGMSLAERAVWLRGFMEGSWRDASRELAQWREEAIAALLAIKEDTVVFSHFIAINVAAGAAENDDRVILFRPDNCSVTILDVDNGRLRLVERGREAETKVN